jgi:hypothetical protein
MFKGLISSEKNQISNYTMQDEMKKLQKNAVK